MNENVVISNPYRDCASGTRCLHPRTLVRPYLMHMPVSQQRWCGGLWAAQGRSFARTRGHVKRSFRVTTIRAAQRKILAEIVLIPQCSPEGVCRRSWQRR